MKEIFEQITKQLPQPLLLAFLTTVVAYFLIFYSSYRTHSDAIRDTRFLSLCVVFFAVALLYLINKKAPLPTLADTPPILIIPKFVNDEGDRCRSPFTATIEARLDKLKGRPGTVHQVRSFITTPEAATLMLNEYGASAILYDISVTPGTEKGLVSFRLITRGKGASPRIPPIPLDQIEQRASEVVNAITTEILHSDAVMTSDPVLDRIARIERDLQDLVIQTKEERLSSFNATPPRTFGKRYSIVVGLNKVENSDFELQWCESDANAVHRLLEQQGFNSRLLLGDAATRQAVFSAIDSIGGEITDDDLVLFYFGGNGTNGQNGGLVPYDFQDGRNPIKTPELIAALSNLKAASRLVLVDACHAAFEVDATHVDRSTSGNFLYFAACGPDQVTYETQGGGIFTQGFITEFRDAVSNSKPIDIRELNQRVALRIQKAGFHQSPVLISLCGNSNLVFEAK
jgi:hypothetical protein